MKPGRLPCVNPRCKRTAPAEQEGEREVICRKCWNLLPVELRSRYQQLRSRQRRMFKLIERRLVRRDIAPSTIELLERQFTGRCEQNWRAIRNYFVTGTKPVGLDCFLREVGL
jgi:hypothetical protein